MHNKHDPLAKFRFMASCSILAISMNAIAGGTAFSQDAIQSNNEEVINDEKVIFEEIVVSGFRGSLRQALNLKRDATGVRESVVAEDIGKFPDLNLAEALQRTTGVSISRDNGEGQQVTVRGLAPQFTRVQLNGMSISSSSIGGTDNGTLGREFDFDLFPSELFNRIDITKTATADLEEGGIAGSLNLQSARPFNFDGFRISASAQAGYSLQPDEVDPRGHLMISNTWGDKFGVLVQAAYSKRSVQVEGSSSVDFTTPELGGSFNINFPDDSLVPESQRAELEQTLFPRLPRTELQISERERLGLSGAFQFRPSDATELVLDLVYSELDRDTFRSNLDAVFRSQGDIEIIEATTSGGSISTGTFRNVERRSETRQIVNSTNLFQAVLSGDHQVNDNLRISGLVGYAESEYDNPLTTTYLFQVVDSEVNLDFTGNPRLPAITTDVDLTDPDNYTTAALRIRPENVQDDSFTARFDLEWGDEENNLQAGVLYTDFEKTRQAFRDDRAVNEPDVSQYSTLVPVDDFASGIGNNGQFPSQYLVADIAIANQTNFVTDDGLVNALELSAGAPLRQADSWSISEQTYGGYVTSNFTGEFLGRRVITNAGVRFVQTDQVSDGFSNGEAVTIENSYFDFLPSANLRIDWTDDVVVRLAFAQTLTRPSLDALRPNTSVRIGNTGSGGNPTLDPFRSNQFDVSFEWYFADDAILSVGGFYKSISGFIVNEAEEVSLRDLNIPLASLDPQGFEGVTLDTPFTISRPVNSTDPAELTGFEVAFQRPLDEIIEGLGFIANYTFADSTVQALSGAVNIETTIPGLSKHSFNLVGYYETDRFSFRASYNWRDQFVETTFIRDRTGLLRTRDSAGFLDASIAYDVTDNVTLTLEGINLLDTEEYTFTGRPELFNRFINTGSQIFLGVRADF